MERRLIGIVATLWFFFALLSLFVALAFSTMGLRMLLPGVQPKTWIFPVFLALPPAILASQKLLTPRVSRILLWPVAVALATLALLLLIFLASTFFGR